MAPDVDYSNGLNFIKSGTADAGFGIPTLAYHNPMNLVTTATAGVVLNPSLIAWRK